MPHKPFEEVLTMAEAAEYLRVPEFEVLRLAEQRHVPAQKIGSDWRFLKRALDQWLTYGGDYSRGFRDFPPWLLGHPVLEELLLALEKHRIQRNDVRSPRRGSKLAVKRHIGVFEDDGDLEEVLGNLTAMRAANSGEGGE